MRDRAFSWDLNMEEQMHPDKARGASQVSAHKTETSVSSSNATDKKRKADAKAPLAPNKISKTSSKSSPPISKLGSKSIIAQQKIKPPMKAQMMDQNVKRAKAPQPTAENKYVPQKMMDQYNMDVSNIVPGSMLGQVMPHPLSHTGQPHTLTRYDTSFSVHLLDHAGMMPPVHPMDASCPRVGAYTKEERQVIIAKFRAKKMRRVWRKQIKYDCRKRLADTRPRVKGRFVSRKERESQAETKEGEGELEAGIGGDYEEAQ